MNIRNRKKFGLRIADFGLRSIRSRVVTQRTARSNTFSSRCVASRLFSRPSSLAPRPSHRRGILLLVVLSLLTLFLMIGTAFLITANQYRRMNKTLAQATEAAGDPAQQNQFLNDVINQIIRDTNNQNSALRFHSLLRDMYGNDGVLIGPSTSPPVQFAPSSSFTITYMNPMGTNETLNKIKLDNAMQATGNQFFWAALEVTIPASPLLPPISQLDDYYNGRLITFNDGDLAGTLARVVDYAYRVDSGGSGRAVGIFTFMPISAANPIVSSSVVFETSHTAVINGQPFNGTGFGFNRKATAGARLDADETVAGTPRKLALLPNTVFLDPQQVSGSNFLGPTEYFLTVQEISFLNSQQQLELAMQRGLEGLGGSDESYDAVDFQNMALAMLPLNPGEIADPTGSVLVDSSGRPLVLPSFHRPALLNYWKAQLAGGATELQDEPNLLRKVLLRPSWLDHPNFTGSNPEFALSTENLTRLNHMIYGPWDVDNDNDGVRDSVWVDFGAAPMEGPDGRLVKPLAAILVLDMDGRLNLNAHGTLDLAGENQPPPPPQPLAGAASSGDLPPGSGYGPADISLEPIVSEFFDDLLAGGPGPDGLPATADDITGRYGKDPIKVPGDPGFDLKAKLKMQGVPQDTFGRLGDGITLAGYATLPDLLSRYALGLNDFGQPVFEALTDTNAPELDMNTPYETDLSAGASRGDSETSNDGVFSVAELERILRAYDVDAGTLPSRLWELAGQFKSGTTTTNIDELNEWRTLLTTDSYDLPVPNAQVPQWMIEKGVNSTPGDEYLIVMGKPGANATLAEILEFQVRARQTPPWIRSDDAANPGRLPQVQQWLRQLLSPDLADGLRLDINRPLGNGRDDSPPGTTGHGVVDEPGEEEGAYWAMDSAGLDGDMSAFTNALGISGDYRDDVDRDGDGIITPEERGILPDQRSPTKADTVTELVGVQNFRRQLLARHLYVLAMTLVDPPPSGANPKDIKARARQLAQWAINVVDYRDPDNCMTPFEYDANPFDGWQVNGNLADNTDWVGLDGQPHTDDDIGGVVWGAERPELLITETLAWHDRRTEDHNDEDAINDEDGDGQINQDDRGTVGSGKDTDFDQRVRPQGAAFVELYNPNPPNPAANADTHDVRNGNGIEKYDMGVDLAAAPSGSPVWRLMLYKDGGADMDPDENIVSNVKPTMPDRSVYFAGFDPMYNDDGVAYYNDATNPDTSVVPPVRPGRYLVVGSGEEQGTGSGEYLADLGQVEGGPLTGSPRGIMLRTSTTADHAVALHGVSGSVITDQDGFEVQAPSNLEVQDERSLRQDFPIPGDDRASTASVAIIDQPRRFSVSEPANGYSDRPENTNSLWNGTTYEPVIDIPLDEQRTDEEFRLMLPRKSAGGGLGGQAVGGSSNPELARRTIPGFKWIYLQRLANPLLPWNPPVGNAAHDPLKAVNPYFTVDSMGVNVTVFNGLNKVEERKDPEDPNTIQRFNNSFAMDSFSSLQRGRMNNPFDRAQDLSNLQTTVVSGKPTAEAALKDPTTDLPLIETNIWNPEAIGMTSNGAAGYWRNRAGSGGNGNEGDTSHNFNAIPDCTLGFMNEPFRDPNDLNIESRLKPVSPFPWFDWNNRPYISANEMMQVPAFRSSQLLHTFSFDTGAATTPKQYEGAVAEISQTLKLKVDGPFGHQPNFFRAHNLDAAGTPLPADKAGIVGLHRIMDFIHVPSRFVGTESWLNPNQFGNELAAHSSGPDNKDPNDPRYGRQPPFNSISNFRDPGRVNLNTIFNENVYFGLLHGNPLGGGTAHMGPGWANLVDSRRGSGSGQPMLQLTSSEPTFFANPFRSSNDGSLVPLDDMLRAGLDCTLHRSSAGTSGTAAQPMGNPFFAADTTEAFRDTNRNPYFRYQPMTRLDNLTTTRSNVYAIWVTIGFFEVEEVPMWSDLSAAEQARFNNSQALYDKVYPDGYMIGREAGSDTGAIERIREFAVVDRTIPVAFEPGMDHNVERAIRLRRRIE